MYEKIEKYEVNIVPNVGYEVRGQWKDDIHDIRTRIVFNYQSYEVVEAEAEGVSVPFEICHQGIQAIKELVGVKAGNGFMRTIKQKVMGKNGCMHVGELARYSITAALNCAVREVPDWADPAEWDSRWAIWQHVYKDNCLYFSQPDALKSFRIDIEEVLQKSKEKQS